MFASREEESVCALQTLCVCACVHVPRSLLGLRVAANRWCPGAAVVFCSAIHQPRISSNKRTLSGFHTSKQSKFCRCSTRVPTLARLTLPLRSACSGFSTADVSSPTSTPCRHFFAAVRLQSHPNPTWPAISSRSLLEASSSTTTLSVPSCRPSPTIALSMTCLLRLDTHPPHHDGAEEAALLASTWAEDLAAGAKAVRGCAVRVLRRRSGSFRTRPTARAGPTAVLLMMTTAAPRQPALRSEVPRSPNIPHPLPRIALE
jgi:hypothetical protein